MNALLLAGLGPGAIALVGYQTILPVFGAANKLIGAKEPAA